MTDYSSVRGFNYQPGYAYNSYEAWRFFDPEVFRRELTAGKRAFPGFNTVRYWLSFDAFRYEERRQAANFGVALDIAGSLGLRVVPVLFNRWHDYTMDNGGIYIDNFVPESNWCSGNGGMDFRAYIDAIVGAHRDDPRILVWDTCNEPFTYGANETFNAVVRVYEKRWLEHIYALCKEAGASQPISFSPYKASIPFMEEFAHISDVFLIHRYDFGYDDPVARRAELAALLRTFADYACSRGGKGILTTETCWGAYDDAKRVEQVRVSLGGHHDAGVGFIAHALAYSYVADLHDPEDGRTGAPGNLCFLGKDGAVRPGHEVFNEF